MKRDAAVERTRKLKALAASATGPEAEVAETRAQNLIKRFKLTDEEIAPIEIVQIKIDEHTDFWRKMLAYTVGRSRGTAAFAKQDGVFLKGERKATNSAKKLYEALARKAVEQSGADFMALAPPQLLERDELKAVVRAAWDETFHNGFVDAITRRLAGMSPPADKKSNKAPEPPDDGGSGLRMAEALLKLFSMSTAQAVADRVFDNAFEHGSKTGNKARCPRWKKKKRTSTVDKDEVLIVPLCLPKVSTLQGGFLIEVDDVVDPDWKSKIHPVDNARFAHLELD